MYGQELTAHGLPPVWRSQRAASVVQRAFNQTVNEQPHLFFDEPSSPQLSIFDVLSMPASSPISGLFEISLFEKSLEFVRQGLQSRFSEIFTFGCI
jgi:hypothetical protein